VVEIAVVDAGTNQTLLDTLINPGCPIQPGALWVHGLSDADVWLRYVSPRTHNSRSAKGSDLHVDSKLGVIVRQR
jgi:hypothetical protein